MSINQWLEDMQDREAYIALNMIEGLGPVSVRRLVDRLGSPAAVFEADRERLMEARGIGEKLALKILTRRDSVDVDSEIAKAADAGVRIITPLDEEYPAVLKTIHDPPLALYIRGRLLPEDARALAIVGSRSTSHYGLNAADRLAYRLGLTGFTVVSGLATLAFVFFLDRGRTITGAAAQRTQKTEIKTIPSDIAATERVGGGQPAPAGD